MDFFQELAGHLLGNMTPAYFVASFIFVLCGATITIMLDVHTRNKAGGRTPESFQWSFFWKDNRLRFILNILIAVFIIRFFSDIFGIQLYMYSAFGVGMSFDGMIVVYKKLRRMFKNKFNSVLKETT